MAESKVKSIEKTQKVSETFSSVQAHHSDVAVSQTAFDTGLVLQMAGNLAVQQLLRAGTIQAKLSISQPNDPDEQEADRVADQVMRMAEPAPIKSTPGVIQHKCAVCEGGKMTCSKCEEEKKVRRKEMIGHPPHASAAVHSQIAALRGGGQPLAPSVRAFFEPRFGANFSEVRVHTDYSAQESARAIQAKAFTTGQDLVFGEGEYIPESQEGQKLLAHELTHVVQQGKAISSPELIQRDQPSASSTSPDKSNAPATSQDASVDVVEAEGKAFEIAKGRSGQAAATVLFSNPLSPDTKDSPELEVFNVDEVLIRQGDSMRRGFDAQGPATAYAALIGGDVGGAVLQQDKFFFSARLKNGKRKLRVTDPSITEADWWKLFSGRDHVYRVTAFPGVASVTGMGGFIFPLGKDLMDDPAKTRFLKDPNMATPADAQSLRDIAGVPPIGQEGEPTSKLPDKVTIPEDQQESFILGYFRSRGLEALAYNEKEAERLTEVFKPTEPGSETKTASGISSEAGKIIAADREQLKVYSELLEQEAKVEAMLSFLTICEKKEEFPPFSSTGLFKKPQKGQIVAMTNFIKERQADIQHWKARILGTSPLIGQLVGMPDPKSRFAPAEEPPWGFSYLEIPRIYGNSNSEVDESPLAKPATAENAEAIRAGFLKKLDAVRKAIRDTRSEMLGDPDFLLGMEGLRLLVTQDLSGITGKNVGLNAKLKDLLRTHALQEKTWSEAEIVIQLGLLFIPGAGPFLSTMAGFVMSAQQMAGNLRRWTASQSSVNPATALVDQQMAESQLVHNTIDLTINAVFVATEAIHALNTLDTTAGGKNLESALKQLEEKEAEQVTAKGATASSGHTLEVTRKGIGRCSQKPCPILRIEFATELAEDTSRGGSLEKELTAAEEMRTTDPEGALHASQSIEAKLEILRGPTPSHFVMDQEAIDSLIGMWESEIVNHPDRAADFQRYIENLRQRRNLLSSNRVGGVARSGEQSEKEIQFLTQSPHKRLHTPEGMTIPDFSQGTHMVGEVKNWNILFPTEQEITAAARGELPKKLQDLVKQVERRRQVYGVRQTVVIDLRGQLSVEKVDAAQAAYNRNTINKFGRVVADATGLPIEQIQIVTW